MSEFPSSSSTDHGLTPGKILKQARVAKNLLPSDVAAKLCLRISAIDDIEADQYQHIPLTYLRGYLRSYARFVGVDEDRVIQALERASDQEQYRVNQPVLKEMRLERVYTQKKSYKYKILGLFIFLLIGIIGFVLLLRGYKTMSPPPATPKTEQLSVPNINQSQTEEIEYQLNNANFSSHDTRINLKLPPYAHRA